MQRRLSPLDADDLAKLAHETLLFRFVERLVRLARRSRNRLAIVAATDGDTHRGSPSSEIAREDSETQRVIRLGTDASLPTISISKGNMAGTQLSLIKSIGLDTM